MRRSTYGDGGISGEKIGGWNTFGSNIQERKVSF